jgi:hypothetical protein
METVMNVENKYFDLTSYAECIINDYKAPGWEQDETRKKMVEEFIKSVRVDVGSKYIKVVTGNSVHSFIVIKAAGKFKRGDVLKPATWNAPAKNFARGNVLDGNFERIRWTGAN